MEVHISPEKLIRFQITCDLERYRVDSLYDKEPETIAWIRSWNPRTSRTFIDIGANIGIYSFFAAAIQPDIHVLAIEPEIKNYIALAQNRLLNNSLNVDVFHLALSDGERLASLRVTDERIGNSNSQLETLVSDVTDADPARFDTVLVSSLDFVVDTFGLPIPEFVKLDVDGHEGSILSGMQSILANDVLQSLLVEFNDVSDMQTWVRTFESYDLLVDDRFDSLPNHSRHRRSRQASSAVNVIFSRPS